MDVYRLTFGVLVVTCCWLGWSRHKYQPNSPPTKELLTGGLLEAHSDPKKFRNIFLVVYLLVMGSDWLQVLPL